MMLSTFRMGLLWKLPYRHSQRFVYYVVINLTTMRSKINHHRYQIHYTPKEVPDRIASRH